MNHPPIDTTQEIRAVLGEWRTHTLNVILSIAAAAMTGAVTVLLIDTVSKPEQLAAMLILLACDLVLIGLAVLRRIDVRLRGLGFLLLGYCGGILALSRGGLAGAGREYLIMLPIIGIILVGVRVGLLLTGLSAAIMGIFALLARLGAFQDWLAQGWLIYAQNPVNLEAECRAKVELNQAHQLLGDYSQSLEQKVEQRTAELVRASDEAIEARSSAEAASRAKSEFLANMSHEIRTPMNAILGMTTFLQDTALTPQQQDFVETIRSSGDVLLAIINDILDISKIEAGRMELALHPFDVRECIGSAIDLVAPKAAEKDLELICTVAESVPTHIFSDPTRLRQILINLLSNAVKYTNAGEVEITTACEKITSLRPATGTLGTYLLNFAVRDTGIGISRQRMDRLFPSFSQVDASMTRKYGGTGSTFHFSLRAPAIEAQRPAYLTAQQPRLKGKRVLVVTGMVYVGDMGNRRIQALDPQGHFINEFSPPVDEWQVLGLAVGADTEHPADTDHPSDQILYAADALNQVIWAFKDGFSLRKIEVH